MSELQTLHYGLVNQEDIVLTNNWKQIFSDLML
jgi:hypothetical protein